MPVYWGSYRSDYMKTPLKKSKNYSLFPLLITNASDHSHMMAPAVQNPKCYVYKMQIIEQKIEVIDLKYENHWPKKCKSSNKKKKKESNEIKTKKEKKIFLRRFPLSRFLSKTLKVNKPAMKKFLKNLSFGVDVKL